MLKKEYIQRIRDDKGLRTKIVLVMGISHITLYRWTKSNNIKLTSIEVLNTICSHLNVKYDDIIEPREKILV
jgi:DNA-binding Xre family transcriptional regulator